MKRILQIGKDVKKSGLPVSGLFNHKKKKIILPQTHID
ncbi:hypothetical protein BMS3Abin07_02472 [bacterium BMS3Abin07]|nr:hypothetical protein BMS3Abin07_02472 [bacterium BMS3Abin07]